MVPACSTDRKERDPGVEAARQPLTGVGNLSVSLPVGVGLTDAALASTGYVRIADRSKVVSGGAPGFIASTGSGETNIGVDTKVRSVTSVGNVVLRERARVEGDVTTSGTITPQNGVVVTGTRTEHTTLAPLTVITRPFEFMGGTNINREPDAPFASLFPGSYGNVTIKSRSGLVLAPGTYLFESVSIDFQAKLRLTSTSEPTVVLIRNGFDFKGDFEYAGDAADVFFGIFGSGTVSLERALEGTLVVPNATLRFAPAHKTFAGSFFAKSIEVEPDLTIDFVPFEHWELIYPAVPIVECVSLFDETHGTAIFGYENELASPITIPLGSSNHLDPDLGFAPPDTFLPGRHRAALLAPFPGTQVTWTLGGTSVTADTSTRRCDLADYPPDQPGGIVLEGSSRPAPAALAGIGPDNFQGVRTEAAPLPWGPPSPGASVSSGTPAGSAGTIQQAVTALDPFRVVITFMRIGDDAACWAGDPFVRVNFPGSGNASNFDRGLATDCGAISACATDYFYDEVITANHISPTDPEVQVRIRLFDFDCCFCGSIDDQNEEEIDVSFTVNNANGAIVSGHADDCASGDGWELCWRVEPNGRPRVCTSWNGQYVDAGRGEDFAASTELQSLPASFARARFTLSNSDFGPIEPWEGVLDQDGCIPIDETPPAAAWRIGPTTALTARMDLTTQHCFDPSGGGCVPDAAGNPRGASFITRRAVTTPGPTFGSLLGPDTTCYVLTTDETLVDPTCFVKKASEGAFATWQDELPPASISVADEEATGASARVAGVVSEILRREVATEGDMGIELGLITNRGGGSEVTFAVDKTCPLLEGTAVVERDSCREGLTLNLRHDMLCAEEPFSACFTDLNLGYFTPCTVGEENCLAGDSYWKYVITHEFGHFIQGAITGTFAPDYRFEDMAGFHNDLPGSPAVCGCSHVTSSNAWHCLQSLEKPNAAQIEGFGQFYASKVWNDPTGTDCTFLYYKEHQFPAPTPGAPLPEPVPPPVAFSCVEPIRFRNTHCIGPPAFSGLAVTDMGVELDWMGFYYAVNTQGDRLTLAELADVYRTACTDPVTLGPCTFADTIAWEPVPLSTGVTKSLRLGAETLLASDDPAQEAKLNHFTQMSSTYGVSRDTTPLP